MQGVQKNREERLAGTLQVLLDQYVNGDKDSFAHQALLEAKRLSGSADQADLLHIIGYTYATQAAQELGKRVSLGVPFLTCTDIYMVGNITPEVFKMAKIQEEINRSGEDDNETLMKLLWKLNAADVEVTLSRVCQMSVGGLLGCLCNPASESDADDCNPAATDREADDSNPAPDREAAEAE
ncbi:hypothetical protein PTKIN_Ptkin01aG0015200 [Pterospermum kingtungense]